MPPGVLCSFCRSTVAPGELDPCLVTVESNSDRAPADRRWQVIHGHYACLQRATAAVGILQLEALDSDRERREEQAREAATLSEFAASWLDEAVLADILARPRGVWSALRAVTPDVVDPADDISLDDLHVAWTEDPSAGRRSLDIPRALLLFHCEGLGWDHSILVDMP